MFFRVFLFRVKLQALHRRKGSPFSIGRCFLLVAVTSFMVLASVFCVASLLAFFKAASKGSLIFTALGGAAVRPDEVAIQDLVRIWEVGNVAGTLVVSSPFHRKMNL